MGVRKMTLYNAVVSSFNRQLKGIFHHRMKDTCVGKFSATSFMLAKSWKPSQGPQEVGWMNHSVVEHSKALRSEMNQLPLLSPVTQVVPQNNQKKVQNELTLTNILFKGGSVDGTTTKKVRGW